MLQNLILDGKIKKVKNIKTYSYQKTIRIKSEIPKKTGHYKKN